MRLVRAVLACLAATSLCIPTLALAEDPYLDLIDPGEVEQVSVPSFSNYAECPQWGQVRCQVNDLAPDLTPHSPYALSGALLALNAAPKVGSALSKAPKSPTPAATVVTAVLVGTALLSESGDPQPLDPPTQEQRDARRLGEAWEFELERSHQTNQPGSLGTQPLYTTLTQAEFEEQSRLGQERLRAQLEEEECRRLGMMCVRNPAPLGGETEISGPVASTEDPKGGGKAAAEGGSDFNIDAW